MTYSGLRLSLCGLLLLAAPSLHAAIIFDNTTTDTLETALFSAGPYISIGDAVTFGGSQRLLTSASVQFYNASATGGTFSAQLQFYEAGAPAGTAIGATYQVDNIAINDFGVADVTFTLSNLLVPNSVVYAISLADVDADLDLGLNFFNGPANGPPQVGTSDADRFIVYDAAFTSLDAATSGNGNLYFQVTAAPVPEPATVAALGLGLVAMFLYARRSNAPETEPRP